MSPRDRARTAVEAEKRDRLFDELAARHNVRVPDDFTVGQTLVAPGGGPGGPGGRSGPIGPAPAPQSDANPPASKPPAPRSKAPARRTPAKRRP
jgi:hypothetical protein